MFSNLVVAEEPLRDIGINPYAVGGIALTVFLVLLFALLSFGKGREHS